MATATAKPSAVSIIPLLYIAAGVVGLVLIVHYGKQLLDKIKAPISDVTKGLADAYVKATTDPIDLAEGVRYQLPNGTTIDGSLAQSAGGANVIYLGVTYKLVEALGNGTYRLEKA